MIEEMQGGMGWMGAWDKGVESILKLEQYVYLALLPSHPHLWKKSGKNTTSHDQHSGRPLAAIRSTAGPHAGGGSGWAVTISCYTLTSTYSLSNHSYLQRNDASNCPPCPGMLM